MNLKDTSVIIKKINRLYELISDIGEASSTEQDLLKAYVLDLYEAVTMSDIASISEKEDDEMLKKIKKQRKTEKKLKKQISKNTLIEDDASDTDEDQDEDVTEIIEDSKEEETQELETEKVEPELLGLFDISAGSDLSDKLSLSPIKDLTKAMGINEKIFTINELFGGHQEEFDNMMMALNGLNTFDEAKNVLMRSVASKYDWHKKDNQKKAKHFIRLVQRRYN